MDKTEIHKDTRDASYFVLVIKAFSRTGVGADGTDWRRACYFEPRERVSSNWFPSTLQYSYSAVQKVLGDS